MHAHRSFQNPPALPHEVVVETLERALRDRSAKPEAAVALAGAALDDDDAECVEHWCVQVGTRAVTGSPLLGPAGLCPGHTTRRFGSLREESLALARSLA